MALEDRTFRVIDGMGSAPRTTLPLTRPLTVGQQTITALHFREPLAGDLIGVNMKTLEGDVAQMLRLASVLCGEPEATLRGLSIRDLGSVIALVTDFFLDSPATPSTSSP